MALGLLHEVGMAEAIGAAGAAGAGDAWPAGAGDAWATATGAAIALSAALSATVMTEPGARPSVGVAGAAALAGADAGAGIEAFCKKMAPNTATHSTIASADAIAARRMFDLQPLRSVPLIRYSTEFRPISLNPTLSGQFEAESTNSAIICAKPQRAWQSRQLGGPPGSALASNTPRATARASVLAATAPSSAISLTASERDRRPVAAANTVSPSRVVCAG